MNTYRRYLASLVVLSSIASLSGCGTVMFKDDVASYPLVPALTESEVVDYYAKALEFDSIITKNIEVDKTNYETQDVSDEQMLERLNIAVRNTESVLNGMTYEYTDENNMAVEEETFHYIKSYLNDKKLTNGEIVSIKQALGYYFVDVQYQIGARSEGVLKPQASMVGLTGAFVHSEYYDTDNVDTAYMKQAVEKLNDYYRNNNITDKLASFNATTGLFSTDPNIDTSNGLIDFTTSTVVDTVPMTDGTIENDVNLSDYVDDSGEIEGGDTDSDGTEVNDIGDSNNGQSNSVRVPSGTTIITSRSSNIDIDEFNKVVGSSVKSTAYMPDLSLVYNIPSAEGDISGIGIYPVGIGGLAKFGFDRSQMLGSITMRFVYKQDLENFDKLYNVNIYPVFSEITTGFSANNDNIIPEFLMLEFEKLIERADRALVNNDLPALMSGDVFSDMGVAILRGYESNYVNVLRQISTIRRVISRDINNSSYLIEVETLRQEGPKGADVYGTYRDKAYVVIQQVGQKFVITDWLTMLRQMQTEPDINPDTAVEKRLVALNLAGEVTDEAKASATSLIEDLYKASTYRILRGPSEVNTADGKITLERGMYDCFNDDVTMLSSSDKEEINSNLRSLLVKYGVGTPATMHGIVTEWIGGSHNQVEFTTEEIIEYTGRNEGVYMRCYYLVSNMGDKWVIDDIQVMECEEHSGDEFKSDLSRIAG